ncbi:MAG: hypothetical protein LLF86_03480 [Nitrospiraceae bacterium]|nr:hypothetical protein [Nitrospiraceae bacterium]
MKKLYAYVIASVVMLFAAGVVMGDNHAVKVQKKEGIGQYLTDAKGMTLYWFKKDSPMKSACSGSCLENWPIYYKETIAVPKGVKSDDFETLVREDGKKQTTFRGYPLYYWHNDKAPGDTFGQGVNNVWYVIDPMTFPVK